MTTIKEPPPPPPSPPATTTGDDAVSSPPSPPPPPTPTPTPTPTPLTREALHTISAEFLASEKLQNAPLSEKKEFLKTKGLSEGEIEELIAKQVEQQEEKGEKEVGESDAAVTVDNKEEVKQKPEEEEEKKDKVGTAGEIGLTPELKEISPSPAPAVARPQTSAQPHQPLIVTYPEYLHPAPSPPAPVKPQSLVKGMYLGAGVATAIYGASKYAFQPMYDELTSARAELAQTALTNLTTFNDKLGALVPNRRTVISSLHNPADKRPSSSHSNNPAASGNALASSSTANNHHESSSDEEDNEDDDASSTTSSLPTHVFHVDASTQTLPLEHDPSLPYPPPSSSHSSESKLSKISSHLATLKDSNSEEAEGDGDLKFELESLTAYLEGLNYESSGMWGLLGGPGGMGMGIGGVGGMGLNGLPGIPGMGGKEDPWVKVKNEIRSVKGVLLNSKNFPAGR